MVRLAVTGLLTFTKFFTFIVNAVVAALEQPVVEFLTEIFPVYVEFAVALAGTTIVIGDVGKVARDTAAKLFSGEAFHVILYWFAPFVVPVNSNTEF